jgi:DNA-binding NarL/FixJ family response regulator
VLREGLRNLLADEPALTVVGEAADGPHARQSTGYPA